MQYRDLIPGRFGGRFIASHIRIPDGGPVPDYVHHHDIEFQMIFCVNGWVRVAYEDQGAPMFLTAGDCFLQPPHIRHRVLESSEAMEVVEITCPAEHETAVDHDMTLPTARRDREFGGQKFVFFEAAKAPWQAATAREFEYRDTGISDATRSVASAIVVRATTAGAGLDLTHASELRFVYVLRGRATLDATECLELFAGHSCAIPPGESAVLTDVSADFEFLDVAAPSLSRDR
ncbi:MAG: cupin domain-containing protein [Woeseiaceae bacterium]